MNEFFIENGELIIKLFIALVLGMLIGAERIFVKKEAGMKTHALVALGSALFVLISQELFAIYGDSVNFDPSRMASQIIVGIGFLGAGSIIFQDSQVKGLTTAGGLWVTAGIGVACGFGMFSLALISTFFVLSIYILLSFFEKKIEKYLK